MPRAGHHIRPSANLLPNGGRPRGVISTVSCVVCRFGSKHELNSKLSAFMEAPLQYYLESARKNHPRLLLAFFIYRPAHYTYHQRAFDWLLPHAKCFIPQLTFRFPPTPQRDGTPRGGVARRRVAYESARNCQRLSERITKLHSSNKQTSRVACGLRKCKIDRLSKIARRPLVWELA